MRVLLFLLSAAVISSACATAIEAPGGLRGCWIERRADGSAATMRWFPEGAGWRGDRLDYRLGEQPAHDAFRLQPKGAGWELCPLDDGLGHGPPCQPARFTDAPGAEGDWFLLRAAGERLQLQFRTPGAALTLFDGARDGCD